MLKNVSKIIKKMESKEFIQILAYLNNIFSHMINLSVSMQGKNINIQKFCEMLNSFIINTSLISQGVREQTKKF